MRMLRYTIPVFILLMLTICGQHLQQFSRVTPNITGEHPGYYEQWLREKMPANGVFPHWMRQEWARWDRMQVRNRAAIDLIDTVYQLGPADIGGRTRSVWIHPTNENIMLAAAISGGMWRTEDGGKNWTALNDQEVSLMASCITTDPNNPDVIYYGTGEGRANSADVDGNGVFKSTDGGKTFSQLNSTVGLAGFETIWDIQHSLDDANTLFVGTHTNGLWRSTDGGASWEAAYTGGNKQVNDILVLPNRRVLISMQSNMVYASDSSGKPGTFYPVTFPAFPGSGQYRRIQMAACEKYPEVVYALVEAFNFSDTPVALYKSRNAGRTWQKMPRPARIGASYQGYCIMLGVHPEDSTRLVAGGVNIAQSDDGGKTWKRKKTGHADHHAFYALPNTKGDFITGTDGGLYRYSWDSEAVKDNLNRGYYVTQFYAGNFGPEGAVAISGAQDNGTHVATSVLTTKKFFGADGAYAHIGLQDGSIAYLSTQDTGLRRIRNFNPAVVPPNAEIKKIISQAFRSDGVDFINAYGMNPADQNQLYYRTNRFLYRTTDAGDNWTQISNIHVGMKAIGISNEADPVVYVGGSGAQLFKFESAASTTVGKEVAYNLKVPAAITDDFLNAITVSPVNKYTIFAAFSNYSTQGRIWKISKLDGADPVFENISGNLPPGLPVNYVATDPDFPEKNLFAGTDFGLYVSDDSGKTWTKETRIPNVAIHEIKMRKDRILFLFTHGRGMWAVQLKGASPLIYSGPAISIFPNPSEGEIQVRLSNYPETANLLIYDTRGRKVWEQTFADHSLKLDLSWLAGGTYYVRVNTNFGSKTEKILLR